MKQDLSRQQGGFGLLEIIVGISIISIAVFALLSAATGFLRLSRDSMNNVVATTLLQEGVEAIRFMRDLGWNANIGSLNEGTTYYLSFENAIWKATTTAQTIDGIYTRSFVMSDVTRDANDDISGSGTVDGGTKAFDLSVSWFSVYGGTASTTAKIYVTDIFDDE